MLTKKDFRALAQSLKDQKGKIDEQARVDLAKAQVAVCKQSNPRFDADRFYQAADIDITDVAFGVKKEGA